MKQKSIFLVVIAALSLCSCTTTYNVISKAALDSSVNQVSNEMGKYGYYPAGSSTDTRNEVTVTGQSYSKYTGYGTKMDNNFITSDTYRFADTAGNTMNFTVGYQLKNSDGQLFVTEVEVKGCETSNVREYNKLCGNMAPKQIIENLRPDTTVEIYDEAKTYLLLGGLSLIALIPILLAY